jgi:peptidoglycan hydrolase-like protein with peptidoglycan-binding domain
MARLINVLTVGLTLAGAGYALSGRDAGVWIVDQAASFVEAATRGAAVPRPSIASSQTIAAAEPTARIRALAARPGDEEPRGRVRFVQDGEPLTSHVVVAPAAKSPQLPRPVAPRLAEVGSVQSVGAGDDDRTGISPSGARRLAKAIQTELRRVGCYHGNIDGDWDAETRKAMKAFNDRVNASLPVAQPDYILLTLVQGHAGKACGAACPVGQSQADDGSCQPRSVLAEARRRAAAPGVAATPNGDRTQTPTDHVVETEGAVRSQGMAAATAAVSQTEGERARAAEERAKHERELIAAAEERKRQRAAEARVRSEAERAARLAEVERAWAAAETRRREEIAALDAREAAVARKAPEPSAPRFAPPPPRSVPGSASGGPMDVALAELPAATDRIAAHVLTKPADARFVGRFLPPPTYRVGRLPPSPHPRGQTSGVRVQAPPPPARPAPRLQAIFKSFERNSP